MAYQNPQFTKRLMELHVEEELHRAELNRLRREATAGRPGWRFRVQWLARTVSSLKWRWEDHGAPETFLPQGQIRRGV